MAEASCTKRTGTSCTHTAKTRTALHMQGLLRIGQVKHLGNSCHSHHDHHQHHHDQKARRALQINPARLIVYSLPHDTYTASQMLPRISCGFFFVIYLLAMLALRCGQGGLSLAAASWLPLLPNRSLRAQVYSAAVVHRLSCRTACGSYFPNQVSTCVPCIRRWILGHWTTREVPRQLVFEQKLFSIPAPLCLRKIPQSYLRSCLLGLSLQFVH